MRRSGGQNFKVWYASESHAEKSMITSEFGFASIIC
jgi:hypothetical protein